MTKDSDIMEDLTSFISNDLIIFISDIEIVKNIDNKFILFGMLYFKFQRENKPKIELYNLQHKSIQKVKD